MSTYQTPTTVLHALRARAKIAGAIVLAGLILAALAFLLNRPTYVATATLLMVADPVQTSGQLPANAPPKPILSADLPSLVTSTTVLTRFKEATNDSRSLDSIRRRIHARISPDSNVLPIDYSSKDPRAAITGANTLADEATAFYRSISTSRYDSLISDLQHRVADSGRRLAALDTDLQSTAQTYPYIDVRGTSNEFSIYHRLIDLRGQRDTLTSALAADRVAVTSANRLIKDAESPALRDLTTTDPAYISVSTQYAKDFAQLVQLESFGSPNYPGLAELRIIVQRDRDNLRAARARAIAPGAGANTAYASALDNRERALAQLAADESKAAVLDQQIATINGNIATGGIAAHVAKVRRDRENEETVYSELETRLAKAVTDRAEAASAGSVVVMDRAQTAVLNPWTGGLFIGLAIILFSLWLAVTVALFIENAPPASTSLDESIAA